MSNSICLNSERLASSAQLISGYRQELEHIASTARAIVNGIDWEVKVKADVADRLEGAVKSISAVDEDFSRFSARLQNAASQVRETSNSLVGEMNGASAASVPVGTGSVETILGGILEQLKALSAISALGLLMGAGGAALQSMWSTVSALWTKLFGTAPPANLNKDAAAEAAKKKAEEEAAAKKKAEEEAAKKKAEEEAKKKAEAAKKQFNRNTDLVYSNKVKKGTIRYIAQQNSEGHAYSSKFDKSYWKDGDGSYGCKAACTSMALSYLGIDATPKKLASMGLVLSENDTVASSTIAPKISKTYGTNISAVYPGTTKRSDLDTALKNFQNGNGQYSPPVLCMEDPDGDLHFVLVTSKNTDGSYAIVDPLKETNVKLNITGSGSWMSHGTTSSGAYGDLIQYKLK